MMLQKTKDHSKKKNRDSLLKRLLKDKLKVQVIKYNINVDKYISIINFNNC